MNEYFLKSNQKLVGEVVKVLVEGESSKEGKMFGYTETNKLINFDAKEDLVGKIVSVKVMSAKTWSLDGELYE